MTVAGLSSPTGGRVAAMAGKRAPRPIAAGGPAPSNVDVAVAALRDAILKGRLKPGERIKEIPMSEELSISRGPIRDALRLLERDGLVEIFPNRGAVVPEISARDVLEVYALRASLGSLALNKVMLEDAVPVKELEAAMKRLETAFARKQAGHVTDADLRFQSAIIDSARLPRVSREYERLDWQVRIFMASLRIRYEDKLERIVSEVQAINTAILEGRAVEAERLWRDKFERWVRDLVDLLPEPFDEDLWGALTAGRSGSPTLVTPS
jgi:DNA-binding GntR family transcriptional regulator